jgi:hypothetical protein
MTGVIARHRRPRSIAFPGHNSAFFRMIRIDGVPVYLDQVALRENNCGWSYTKGRLDELGLLANNH